MSGGAWGPQPHQIGNPAYFKSGGGAKLIARRPYRPPATQGVVASYSEVVPANAGYLIVRCFGPGGDSDGTNSGGAGAAFAREDRFCTPGQTIAVSVPANGTGATAYTTFSLAGTVICSAEGAYIAQNGTVAGSIGTVRAAGGLVGSPGTNGGPAGAGSTASRNGGGSGGESNATDALIPGGAGGNANGTDNTDGHFPGGGAGWNGRFGAKGYCVAEFWSAKP